MKMRIQVHGLPDLKMGLWAVSIEEFLTSDSHVESDVVT